MPLNNLKTKFMTRNDCFTAGRKITPKGIMIHSTATPGVMAEAWFDRWNKSYKAKEINRQVCVHGFVDDKEIWQYLPWDHRGWHAGGSANNSYIGIEICEPSGFFYSHNVMIGYDVKENRQYYKEAFSNAVDLCVFLCKEYRLTEKDIIGHYEGHKMGIASNHADPNHWFSKHKDNMDTFRKAVKEKLENDYELELAVRILAERGIINTPYYWMDNAREGKNIRGDYAGILIKRMAALCSDMYGGIKYI